MIGQPCGEQFSFNLLAISKLSHTLVMLVLWHAKMVVGILAPSQWDTTHNFHDVVWSEAGIWEVRCIHCFLDKHTHIHFDIQVAIHKTVSISHACAQKEGSGNQARQQLIHVMC